MPEKQAYSGPVGRVYKEEQRTTRTKGIMNLTLREPSGFLSRKREGCRGFFNYIGLGNVGIEGVEVVGSIDNSWRKI